MPSIHFTVTAEDKNLQKVLKDIEKGVGATSKKVEESGMTIDDIVTKLTKGAAAMGLAFSAKELVSNVTKVRGEFQQLEVAFNTMLGSGERASALMAQLTQTAAVTPFGLQEVAGSAKQLLAYGVAAEEVNDRLIMLGDIAAGLSIPLSDLAYLYGTTMTQGRMYTQDLNQFMGRGIPLADELAKQFGVTKDKVKDLVTSGKVGFEEMHKSLVAMTSAGGKFGGLMEAQSKTIKGQISNLEDAIDVMFNNIGKSQEGVINTALSVASKLVENYETVGKVLMSLVATYGAYKAAIIATVAIQKVEAAIVQQAAVQKALAAMAGHTLTASQARGAAVGQLFAAAQAKVAASLRAVSAAAMANPYALVTAAVVGLVAGVITLSKKIDENTNAFNRVKEAGEKYAEFLKTWEQQAQEAISTIQSETATNTDKIKAYQKLQSVMPAITEQYTMEELAVLGVAKANEELAKQREEAEKKGRQIQINNLRTLADQKYKSISGRQLTGKKVEKEEIEEYHEIIRQIKELQAIDKKLEEVAAKPKVKDKKYWEDLKKDLQMKFEALTPDMEGTDTWDTLKKQIQEADTMIAKYNVSKSEKDDKEANELKAKKASYKLALEEYKQEIISATQEAQMEIRQAEINAMKDGNEKALAQIDLDYDKRIAENENRKREFIKEVADLRAEQWEIENPKRAEKGEKFDKSKVTEADLTPQQKAILAYYDLLAQKERELAQANAAKELLNQYQTYMQKRNEIAEKYDRDRKAMKNADGTYKKGFSKENETILNKQEKDALEAVDVEFAMKEQQFETWANSIANMSLRKLQELLNEAKQQLYIMERDNEVAEKMGVKPKYSDKQIAEQRGKVVKAEEAIKNKNVNNVERDWKDLYQTLRDVEGQFKEIGDAIGGTVGEVMSAAGEISASTISMVQGIVSLTDGSIQAIKGTSEGATTALKAVETASVILAIVGAAIKIVTKIINLAREIHDKKHEKEIENLQQQVDNLNKGYDELGEAIERAFSKDASNLIKQQNDLLKQQKELTKQMIGEEEEKKKKDDDRINSWKKELEDIDKQIEENKQKAIDAIFGEDLQSAIENFADAYADAVASGEDKWTSVKDTVKNMMKQMVIESIKSALASSKAMENIRKKLLEFYEDGILTQVEQDEIYKMAENVQKELDRQFGWADDILKDGSSTEQKATYGGFESMSEDTGSELNGRFTALQMAGEEIKTQVIASVMALNALVTSTGISNSLLGDILTQHAITNAHLEDIVKYAKVVSGYGVKLDKIVEQTKNL